MTLQGAIWYEETVMKFATKLSLGCIALLSCALGAAGCC